MELFLHLIKILSCLTDDNAREGDERDEVRDGHKAVDDISEHPDRLEL